MNLDVHFMTLLIFYYLIIQLLQMERRYIYICSKCHIERDAPTYVKYVVFQSPIYMKTLLSQHPFYIQLFSFLNIGLHIQKKIGVLAHVK